jgi:flagellar biosynthesis protein FliP
MLAPIVLIAIVYVLEMVKSSRMRNVIDVLGRRSLEIYTSNLLVLKLASRFETGPMIIIPYFILNIVIALIFCYCNDYIQNILCKRK